MHPCIVQTPLSTSLGISQDRQAATAIFAFKIKKAWPGGMRGAMNKLTQLIPLGGRHRHKPQICLNEMNEEPNE